MTRSRSPAAATRAMQAWCSFVKLGALGHEAPDGELVEPALGTALLDARLAGLRALVQGFELLAVAATIAPRARGALDGGLGLLHDAALLGLRFRESREEPLTVRDELR